MDNGTGWLTPVATVLAVFVAGFLNWLAQYKFGERRAADERAAVADQRAADEAVATGLRKAEEKAAARVIQADLATVASRLQHIVQRDLHWYSFFAFSLDHWDQHETTLARALSADDWVIVSQSALELRALEDGFRRVVGPGGPREGQQVLWQGSENAQKGFRESWNNASVAHHALAKLAEVEPEDGLLHDGAA